MRKVTHGMKRVIITVLKALAVLLLILFFAALFLAAMASADPAGKTQIVFHAESRVQGLHYALGDIAEIKGATPEEHARLRKIELGQCPSLGIRFPLNARVLTAQLERQGAGEDEGVMLRFPKRMLVERASQEVNMRDLRAAVEKEIRARVPFAGEDLVLESVQLPQAMPVPAGKLTFEIDLRMPARNAGFAAFNANVLVDGVSHRKLSGSVKLDMSVEVLQAASGILRGEAIQAGACRRVPQRLSQLRDKPIVAEDLGTSLTARRDLKPGDPLTWSNVEKRMLVRNGQTVRMLLESPSGLRIAAQGQARSNGSLGDTVDVVNVSSGKRIQGVVAGEKVVQVAF